MPESIPTPEVQSVKEELQRLLAEATRLPWVHDTEDLEMNVAGIEAGVIPNHVHVIRTAHKHGQLDSEVRIAYQCSSPYFKPQHWTQVDAKDAALIVAAVNSLPSLLAELSQQSATIERLEAELDSYKSARDTINPAWSFCGWTMCHVCDECRTSWGSASSKHYGRLPLGQSQNQEDEKCPRCELAALTNQPKGN